MLRSEKTLFLILFTLFLLVPALTHAQTYTTKSGSNSGKSKYWNDDEDRRDVVKAPVDSSERVEKDMKRYGITGAPEIRPVAKLCYKRWETAKCHIALSKLGTKVVKGYIGALEPYNAHENIESLNDGCGNILKWGEDEGASDDMPKAMDLCVGTIRDINHETHVPVNDVNQYELMVGSIHCLMRRPECSFIDKQLEIVAKSVN